MPLAWRRAVIAPRPCRSQEKRWPGQRCAVKDKELRRKIGLDGVRCAMTVHQTDAALEFLRVLAREFPTDPDALYVSIHAYSDLSTSFRRNWPGRSIFLSGARAIG